MACLLGLGRHGGHRDPHSPSRFRGRLGPTFFDFFNVVLSHYQTQALHLDPRSIVLLVAFSFLCEAIMGVAPSVALFCHFSCSIWSTAEIARDAWHSRLWRRQLAPASTSSSAQM